MLRGRLRLFLALALVLLQFVFVAPRVGADAASTGSWTLPVGLPLLAIHGAVVPSGKVLLFSANNDSTSIGSASTVFDPATATLKDASVTFAFDMMCGGNAMLEDGRVFVAGGRVNNQKTAFFDYTTEKWTEGPSMLKPRYYPGTVELPDGRVPIFFGREATADMYDPHAGPVGTITRLPSTANRTLVPYPRMHLLPSGNVFLAGMEQNTALFDVATSTWTPMGRLNYGSRFDGTSVILPGLNKVMNIGGSSGGGGPTKTAEIIDFSDPTPQWRYTATSMHLARSNMNVVLLPDGKVLVVGGRGSTVPRQPEIFDPVTETWTLMAPQVAEREYHSIALLMPDGRVFSAGAGDQYGKTYEVFSPPYLFKGTQPTISGAPSSVEYGDAFAITTPDAANISRVTLVKPSPVSHAVNADQRFLELNFTHGNGQVIATAPGGPTLAPPGWYMLFVLDSSGVPSKAKFVHIAGAPAACAPSSPTSTATPLQASAPAGSALSYTVSVKNNDGPTCGSSSFALQATVPSGWQATFDAPTLTVPAGGTQTTTLHVTSPTSASPGSNAIPLTATRTTAPNDSGPASVTYTVDPSGGGAGGTFTDNFNRTTGLGSDWQVVKGTMSITNNELRNGAVSGLHAAVVPALQGAGQTVSANFATTAQNTGVPTLGLVLRYQDPSNYYLLSRRAGGSSLLQISKVVNGVTTVLAQTTITNPSVNVLFGMTAKVTGSTLTVTQGTKSVSVNDATFTTGSVGVLMGNPSAPDSHRADDFSATVE